jgi:hypothetical protein
MHGRWNDSFYLKELIVAKDGCRKLVTLEG